MLKFVKIFNFGRCEGFEPSPLVSQTNSCKNKRQIMTLIKLYSIN